MRKKRTMTLKQKNGDFDSTEKDFKLTPNEEAAICCKCPFPSCNRGTCDYFQEMKRRLKKKCRDT